MQIRINSEQKEIKDGTSIGDLIELLELKRQFVAVELNQELVPREQHDQHVLNDGDQIEIVTLVGGG
ncbi:MAG: sulfur carrier protein ThiS [Planctomycetales bacterium]|nr:sulfur carrier protein ThiS [Planctomycetales bacterium]